jgi:hypothetical protein
MRHFEITLAKSSGDRQPPNEGFHADEVKREELLACICNALTLQNTKFSVE